MESSKVRVIKSDFLMVKVSEEKMNMRKRRRNIKMLCTETGAIYMISRTD